MFGSLPAFGVVCSAVAQNMYLPTYQLSCKAPLYLPRKQLHLPYSNDLPARPRGDYPLQNIWGGGVYCVAGAFFTFFFVLTGGRLPRIWHVFAENSAL